MPGRSTLRAFSRRCLMTGTGALGLTLMTGAGVSLARSRRAGPTTRAAFDRFDQSFNSGNGYKNETNDKDSSGLSGKLAWGEAYVLQGYALMYSTYRDTYYLDKMIDHIDHVLANRDSERGVTDYLGTSHPAWRADHHYTVGSAEFSDEQGSPVLEVRSALAYGDDIVATVGAGSAIGTFRLDVRHDYYGRTTSYDNLTMDQSSSNYAVDRVYQGFPEETPDRVLVTVKNLRQDDQVPANPRPDSQPFVSKPYVFEVHTGQIALPLVRFARIVREEPDLWANPLYKRKATAYLAAAQETVAVHDPEWRENDAGEGYYITLPGAPVWHANIDNPLNHFLSLGRAILQLAVVTGDQVYVERARKMARTLRNDLRLDPGGAFVWSYWWSKGAVYNGWDLDDPASEYRPWMPGPPVAEDTSHSQIDLNYALEAYQANLRSPGEREPIFTERDMARFAATFTQNIAATVDGTATVHRYVDGSGETGIEDYERQAAAWADLTPWDASILDHLREIFTSREFGPTPAMLYCLARLNHAAH